ncbi:MAG: hypothetical protein Q9162_000036 [Coniocarpon cinnabarinum]
MSNAELYIVVYRAQNVRLQALGLGVQHKDEWTVYEVVGTHPTFTRNSRRGPPDDSVSDVKTIKVGEIPDSDVSDIEKAYEATNVNNDDPTWTCREFVMEILTSLSIDAQLPSDSDEDSTSDDSKEEP